MMKLGRICTSFEKTLKPIWLGKQMPKAIRSYPKKSLTDYWQMALALGFGTMFVAGSAYGLSAAADRAWARSLFFASMPYLIVLLLGLAI